MCLRVFGFFMLKCPLIDVLCFFHSSSCSLDHCVWLLWPSSDELSHLHVFFMLAGWLSCVLAITIIFALLLSFIMFSFHLDLCMDWPSIAQHFFGFGLNYRHLYEHSLSFACFFMFSGWIDLLRASYHRVCLLSSQRFLPPWSVCAWIDLFSDSYDSS